MSSGQTRGLRHQGQGRRRECSFRGPSQRPSELNSPIERGAVSTNLCHLGNIGVRCGGITLTYDLDTESITAASDRKNEANALLAREYRKGCRLAYKG